MALFSYYPRHIHTNYLDNYDDWPQLSELLFPSHLQLATRPQHKRLRNGAHKNTNYTSDQNKFSIKVDVSHFTPEEITVKTVDNNVIIHGKHEEKMDKHGWVKREFTRRYALPEDCESDKLMSNLSGDGILTVEAPKKRLEAIKGDERVIPINVLRESPQQPSIQSQPTGDRNDKMQTN